MYAGNAPRDKLTSNGLLQAALSTIVSDRHERDELLAKERELAHLSDDNSYLREQVTIMLQHSQRLSAEKERLECSTTQELAALRNVNHDLAVRLSEAQTNLDHKIQLIEILRTKMDEAGRRASKEAGAEGQSQMQGQPQLRIEERKILEACQSQLNRALSAAEAAEVEAYFHAMHTPVHSHHACMRALTHTHTTTHAHTHN